MATSTACRKTPGLVFHPVHYKLVARGPKTPCWTGRRCWPHIALYSNLLVGTAQNHHCVASHQERFAFTFRNKLFIHRAADPLLAGIPGPAQPCSPLRPFHSRSFAFSFVFLGLHLWHMEVPRPGVKSELQLPAYTTATATPALSHVCDLHHSSGQHRIL